MGCLRAPSVWLGATTCRAIPQTLQPGSESMRCLGASDRTWQVLALTTTPEPILWSSLILSHIARGSRCFHVECAHAMQFGAKECLRSRAAALERPLAKSHLGGSLISWACWMCTVQGFMMLFDCCLIAYVHKCAKWPKWDYSIRISIHMYQRWDDHPNVLRLVVTTTDSHILTESTSLTTYRHLARAELGSPDDRALVIQG